MPRCADACAELGKEHDYDHQAETANVRMAEEAGLLARHRVSGFMD